MADNSEPYLQVTFDAIRRAGHVARAAQANGVQLSRNDVIGGLLDMWQECWRRKSSTVAPIEIQAYFGADITQPLLAFEFVAPEGVAYRAKGSGRYLRISEGQSKGGHAAKGNLIPGPKPRGSRKKNPSAVFGSQPSAEEEPKEVSSAESSAPFGPSSEQRSANKERKEEEAPPPQRDAAMEAAGRFEAARAVHFGGIASGLAKVASADFAKMLEGHQDDEEWALQTYRHFWTDPWARKLRPPGALHAFLGQWANHVRPKERPDAEPEQFRPPGAVPDARAHALWEAALTKLEKRSMRYGLQYLRQVWPDRVDGNGVLWLLVRDKYFRDWVLEHYGGVLEDALGMEIHVAAVEPASEREEIAEVRHAG